VYTLITAASSSGAYNLQSKLNKENTLLGDYLDLPDFLVRSGKMIRLPDPKNTAYAHQMLALCLDKDIDTVYILRSHEKLLLLEAKQLFAEYDIKIIAADDQI
jgi:hypothetical protein